LSKCSKQPFFFLLEIDKRLNKIYLAKRLSLVRVGISDELKIVLEDVNEDFDTVIEAFNLVREILNRSGDENKREHEELRKDIVALQADMVTVKKGVEDLKSETFSSGRTLMTTGPTPSFMPSKVRIRLS
jgi:hypothetical protein